MERDSKYQHTFVRANVDQQNTRIPYKEFTENEYVLVSTRSRINISAGFIINIKEDSIIVLLDRYVKRSKFYCDIYSSNQLIIFQRYYKI